MLIGNIQLLRFLAAAAVVFYHVNLQPFGYHSEFGAVVVFFCVSGFIMTMITRSDAHAFLWRRFVRIVPFYWLVTLGYLILVTLPGGRVSIFALPDRAHDIVLSMLFIPFQNSAGHIQPFLDVGWTLNLEVYFYVVFSAALASRTHAPAITAAVVSGIWVLLKFVDAPANIEFYGSDHVLFFVMGIMIYYLWRLLPAHRSITAVGLIAAAAYPFAMLQTSVGWLHFIAPPLLVLSFLMIEKDGFGSRSKTAMLLGAASYSIYLTHVPVLAGYRIAQNWISMPLFESSLPAAIIVFTISICVGVSVHLWVERPLLTLMSRRSAEHRAQVKIANTSSR